MTKDAFLQGVAAAAFAAVGAYFHQLMFPCLLLVVVMALDYLTGMVSAWIHRTISSKAGVIGVIKKLCYMIAVAVAVVVDQVIRIAAHNAGIETELPNIFALLVTFWLILNECISILENLSEIGVPLPNFLMQVIKRLKKNTEDAGGQDDDKG